MHVFCIDLVLKRASPHKCFFTSGEIQKWKELPPKEGARMETVDIIGLICAVVAVSIVIVIF